MTTEPVWFKNGVCYDFIIFVHSCLIYKRWLLGFYTAGVLQEPGTPFASTWVQPRFYGTVRVAHFFKSFCVFMFLVPCCDVRCDFRIKKMIGSSLPPVVSYLCLFTYSGVKHIIVLCFLFCLSLSCVLGVQCCQFLWIAPSVFSNVYLLLYPHS